MQCSGLINMVTRSMLSWRFLLRTQTGTGTKNLQFSSSSPTTVIPKTEKNQENEKLSKYKRSNSMVAAAFQSLKDPELTLKNSFETLDETISSAKSIDDLLNIADSNHVNKKHALRIVSVLAEWASENKIKISDFETDARFHKLCRMLGRNYRNKTTVKFDPKTSGDLATVLEVTGDDEAAKLVGTISFEQMIKVIIN